MGTVGRYQDVHVFEYLSDLRGGILPEVAGGGLNFYLVPPFAPFCMRRLGFRVDIALELRFAHSAW